MKMKIKQIKSFAAFLAVSVMACGLSAAAPAAADAGKNGKGASAQASDRAVRQANARAKRMVNQALGIMENGEEERAVGVLEAVPKMFPDSPVKYLAYLELGRIHLKKGRNDEALAQLRNVEGSQDVETKAEALLLQARVHLAASRDSEASMVLRRITTDFPESLFANDAWYEIGQIHFKGKRWFRAQEAFARVGTAVPRLKTEEGAQGGATNVFAEAGQRLYAVVSDRDLAVAAKLGKDVFVKIVSKSGDSETLKLRPYGQLNDNAIASVPTIPSPSAPNDGVLTVQGGEKVDVVYVDASDSSGARNITHVTSLNIVSTAVLAVMDGAYRQNVKGVFAGNPAFLRLKDLDLDTTAERDKVKISVKSYRKRPKPTDEQLAAAAAAGEKIDEEEEQWDEVASGQIVLEETEKRSGVFEGRITPVTVPVSDAGQIETVADGKLVFSFIDKRHVEGVVPREVTSEVVVLTGGSAEPQSIVSSASDPVMQSRKLLLEARLLNQWGQIFKDVGLDKQASQKANEGLERIEDIFSLGSRFALPREITENAYAAKWDLLMVKGELRNAITVCRQLLRVYPDTVLADLALLRIAKARGESRELNEINEAASIYRSVLGMPNSRNKAEAQFLLATVLEKIAKIKAARKGNIKKREEPDYTAAISAYRACAENYPQSSFAGESFKRVVTFQIGKKDYARANETLERVFQDYPDAPWLDEMLLRWGIVKYRTGDVEGAKEKFRRILEEYPSGPASAQAQNFLQKLNR